MRLELEDLEKQIERLRDEDKPSELAAALNKLAYSGINYCDPDRSRALAREALELSRDLGLRKEEARSLMIMGVIGRDTCGYSEAISNCRRALNIYMEIDDRKGTASVQGTLGSIYLNMGLVREALSRYLESLNCRKDFGADEYTMAHTYYNVGSCYLTLNRLEEAESAYRMVMDVWKDSGDDSKLAYLYNNLGCLREKQGRSLQALDYLQRALDLRLELEEKKNAASTLCTIGDLLRDMEDSEWACDSYSQALKLFRQTDHPRGVAYAMICRGRTMISLGLLDSAATDLHEGLKLAEELDLKRYVLLALEYMIDLERSNGKTEEALNSACRLLVLQKEYYQKQNSDRLAELQIQFENELKERETEIYRLRNIELSEKNSELQEALQHVRKLKGLLPICSHCKKIRDDDGYWEQIESYISRHSDTEFTHGICPDCMKEFYSKDGRSG